MRWSMALPMTAWYVSAPSQSSVAATRCVHSLLRAGAKQKGYRLKKQFRTLMNDTMTNVWDGEWEDADSGLAMRGFGVEVWIMRGGKIAIWEAAFNVGARSRAASPTFFARSGTGKFPPVGRHGPFDRSPRC